MENGHPKAKARRRDNDGRAERKRELDRLAQRATRERTKNRIAFLEQKLASLQSRDQGGTISRLTNTIEELRNDNQRLQSAMMKMRFAINEALETVDGAGGQAVVLHCGCPSKAKCACPSDSPKPTSMRNGSTTSGEEDVAELPFEPSQPGQLTPDAASLDHGLVPATDALQEFFGANDMPWTSQIYEMSTPEFLGWQQPAMPSPFDYRMPVPEDGVAVARDVDKWHVSNGAFIECMDTCKRKIASNQTVDLRIPFKAAMWGWDMVGAEAQHPVWEAIKRVDQKVFGTWTSKAQRAALMYVCQSLLQYREHPTKENLERVPKWFRPRPAQSRIQHPAVVDFLVWPGMRDRLVFEHDKYTRTGEFSAAFVNNFNFHWPYPDKDMFLFNSQNATWEISKTFMDYVYNFHNWTMRPDFFKQFPEMQHDVPCLGEQNANSCWRGT